MEVSNSLPDQTSGSDLTPLPTQHHDSPPNSLKYLAQLQTLLSLYCSPECQRCSEFVLHFTEHLTSVHAPALPTYQENHPQVQGLFPPPTQDTNVSFDPLIVKVEISEVNVSISPIPECPESNQSIEENQDWTPSRSPEDSGSEELIRNSSRRELRSGKSINYSESEPPVDSEAEPRRSVGRPRLYEDGFLHICSVCQKGFPSFTRLRLHLEIHNLEKSHLCDICGKKFASKKRLSEHKRVHKSGGKQFTCSTCGKEFDWLSRLQMHERVHSGEKPFICESCGLSFTRVEGLTIHARSHSGEKPYRCEAPNCGKGFWSASILARHVRIHGDKNIHCDICGQSFIRKDQLKQHMRTHVRTQCK